MAIPKSNRIAALLTVLVLFCLGGFVVVKLTAPVKHQPVNQIPTAERTPDGDTTAVTLSTVAAEMSGMRSELARVQQENAQLKAKQESISLNHQAIVNQTTENVTKALTTPDSSGSNPLGALAAKVEALTGKVEGIPTGRPSSGGGSVSSGGSGVPAGGAGTVATRGSVPSGFGFDPSTGAPDGTLSPQGRGGVGAVAGADGSAAAAPVAGTIQWVEPMGSRFKLGADGKPVTKPDGSVEVVPVAYAQQQEAQAAMQATQAAPATPEAPKTRPFFTVPENSVLMNSSLMTALIGRTPVNGNLRDPMEFKVLIGRNNLAANGQEVPDDIAGMVVSGIAVGDWMLSCVEGHINSVTFLFNDGTIRTVSRRSSAQSMNTNAPRNNASRLGYITDERGAPCINGQQITNAPSYLSQVVGVKALETAARAAAMSQTTQFGTIGGVGSAVTGNPSTFVLGQAAAGATSEVSNWIMQRLQNSFDAIYVQPGMQVAVHLTAEIALDKDPSTSRKLDYGRNNGNGSVRATRTRALLD